MEQPFHARDGAYHLAPFDPADASIATAFILHLIERADLHRLANGHWRLTIPVTQSVLDDLATLGAAAADRETDDPGEESDPAEWSEPGDADHRDAMGSGHTQTHRPGAPGTGAVWRDDGRKAA